MEDKIDEGRIIGAKEPEPLEASEHKDKGSCICKISAKSIGTGFFCKMTYENELVPVLITNYHVIDDKFIESKDSLKVYINEKSKFININKNRIIYLSSSNKYDVIYILVHLYMHFLNFQMYFHQFPNNSLFHHLAI